MVLGFIGLGEIPGTKKVNLAALILISTMGYTFLCNLTTESTRRM